MITDYNNLERAITICKWEGNYHKIYLSDYIKSIDSTKLIYSRNRFFGKIKKNVARPTFELTIILSTDKGWIMSEDTEDFYSPK